MNHRKIPKAVNVHIYVTKVNTAPNLIDISINIKLVAVKPELLKTAQGLFEVLQDYIRLKSQELTAAR